MKTTLINLKKVLWILSAGLLGMGVSKIITYLFPVTHVNSLAETSIFEALFRAIPPAIVVGYCISKALKKNEISNNDKHVKSELHLKEQLKLTESDKNYQLSLFINILIFLVILFTSFLFITKDNGFNSHKISVTDKLQDMVLKDPDYINANEATKEAIRKKFNIELRSVTMPDGKIVANVPNYVSDSEIVKLYIKDNFSQMPSKRNYSQKEIDAIVEEELIKIRKMQKEKLFEYERKNDLLKQQADQLIQQTIHDLDMQQLNSKLQMQNQQLQDIQDQLESSKSQSIK